MTYDPDRHHRRSTRLQGYDYGQEGAYFVTMITHERGCLFGDIMDGEMRLNDAGRIAEECWLAIPDHFAHVDLDAYVIMPNHVHGIIVITENVGTSSVGAEDFPPLPRLSPLPLTPQPFRSPSKTVGSVVRGFKIGVTKWFRANTYVYTVWQRNYYDHIIRDEPALHRIRQYIVDNPKKWALDSENPAQR